MAPESRTKLFHHERLGARLGDVLHRLSSVKELWRPHKYIQNYTNISSQFTCSIMFNHVQIKKGWRCWRLVLECSECSGWSGRERNISRFDDFSRSTESTACPSAWTPLRRWKVVVLADALGMSKKKREVSGATCCYNVDTNMPIWYSIYFNIIIDFNKWKIKYNRAISVLLVGICRYEKPWKTRLNINFWSHQLNGCHNSACSSCCTAAAWSGPSQPWMRKLSEAASRSANIGSRSHTPCDIHHHFAAYK